MISLSEDRSRGGPAREPDSDQIHSRRLSRACIIIIGPAIARLERVGFAIPVPGVLVLLLGVLAVHDLVTLRRLHRATALSSLLVVIALGAVLSVVGTATGQAIVDALRTAL